MVGVRVIVERETMSVDKGVESIGDPIAGGVELGKIISNVGAIVEGGSVGEATVVGNTTAGSVARY